VRIVVSGTHASGKSTLVSDLSTALGFAQLPDPFELLDDVAEPSGASSFVAQLELAAERLVELPPAADVVAERGPIDLLAYLEALAVLGRPSAGAGPMARLRTATATAMSHVDLLVVVPLDPDAGIVVPDDEDPELREVMDERLLDLCDDEELVGGAGTVVEVGGPPWRRVAQVLAAVEAVHGA
jgi:predicted ATPase